MEIRQCRMDELDAVAAFYDRVTLHLSATVNYPRWEYGVYPSARSVKEAIADKAQYICTENSVIAGAFVLNSNPGGAYERGNWRHPLEKGEYLVIHTLAVDPERQGHGVGRCMVNYCLSQVSARGYSGIRLDVVPENLPARRLYESLGFTYAGEVELGRGLPDIPYFALYEWAVPGDRV